MIYHVTPRVQQWRHGTDWIAHLGRVAAVRRREKCEDITAARALVQRQYLAGDRDLFRHWQIIQPLFIGTLADMIPDWNLKELPVSAIDCFVRMAQRPNSPRAHLMTFHFTCSLAATASLMHCPGIVSVAESPALCPYDKLGFGFVGPPERLDYWRLVEEEYCERIDRGESLETASYCLPGEFAVQMVATAPRWQWGQVVASGSYGLEISSLLRDMGRML